VSAAAKNAFNNAWTAKSGLGRRKRQKAVASDGPTTISGKSPIPGFIHVAPAAVKALAAKVGHSLAPNGYDEAFEGEWAACHAEKKLAVLTPAPIGVSNAMCSDCVAFFRHLACHTGTARIVRDPHCERVFMPDGTIKVTP